MCDTGISCSIEHAESQAMPALLSKLIGAAGGVISLWQGDGTDLPWGFAVVRMITTQWECLAKEGPPLAGSSATACPTLHPLQLLCRTLRLAPTSYRRYEIVAQPPNALLIVAADMRADQDGNQTHVRKVEGFRGVAEFAAALRPFAVREGISVQLIAGEQVVVLSRDAAEPACRRG